MKSVKDKELLIIGIGNEARADDGLGWAFLKLIAEDPDFFVECHYRYQLNLEDVEYIRYYSNIIFVDATKSELSKGFSCKRCVPKKGFEFSSHILSPETILWLCAKLYKYKPVAKVMVIQGFHWEFEEGLSYGASKNLIKAFAWFKQKLMS